jgi:hypothetical protein
MSTSGEAIKILSDNENHFVTEGDCALSTRLHVSTLV